MNEWLSERLNERMRENELLSERINERMNY